MSCRGFSGETRAGYKDIVRFQAIEIMQAIIRQCEYDQAEIDAKFVESAAKISGLNLVNVTWDEALGNDLNVLWHAPFISLNKESFDLPKNSAHVLSSLQRYSSGDFIPTEDDIARLMAQ
jgi:hypothetical protein